MGFHALIHTCLDVVEEKDDSSDSYLGLLTATEAYRVYGYASNTQIKLMVAVSEAGDLKASNVGSLLRHIHTLYIDAVSNPFHPFNAPLDSPAFDASLAAIASSWQGGLIR